MEVGIGITVQYGRALQQKIAKATIVYELKLTRNVATSKGLCGTAATFRVISDCSTLQPAKQTNKHNSALPNTVEEGSWF